MRIYLDTSVLGGCFDEEFEEWSVPLMEAVRSGRYKAVISEVTEMELRYAPDSVKGLVQAIPSKQMEVHVLSEEAKELAAAYIKEKVVTRKSMADTQHIAVASIARVDLLVSWNFKHIVNYDRIRLYNAVNLKLGYPLLEIRSPRDLIS